MQISKPNEFDLNCKAMVELKYEKFLAKSYALKLKCLITSIIDYIKNTLRA